MVVVAFVRSKSCGIVGSIDRVRLQGSASATVLGGGNQNFSGREKQRDIRAGNILAARAVSDTLRTSLGPKVRVFAKRIRQLFNSC